MFPVLETELMSPVLDTELMSPVLDTELMFSVLDTKLMSPVLVYRVVLDSVEEILESFLFIHILVIRAVDLKYIFL